MTCKHCKLEKPACELQAYRGLCEECAVNSWPERAFTHVLSRNLKPMRYTETNGGKRASGQQAKIKE